MTALGQTVTCLRDLKLPAGGARGARRFVDPWRSTGLHFNDKPGILLNCLNLLLTYTFSQIQLITDSHFRQAIMYFSFGLLSSYTIFIFPLYLEPLPGVEFTEILAEYFYNCTP